jgi:hypothetical protein
MATEKHILVESVYGLHCINLENGEKLWTFTNDGIDAVIQGTTPAVDQTNGFIYYQANNRLYKINALNGAMIAKKVVASPAQVASGNTILVNDAHGYHILTFWYTNSAYSGTIRCYDINLNLEWIVTGLNSTYKNCITYYDGVVFNGTGDNFGGDPETWYAGLQEDCKVIAYNIADGSVKWTTVLSDPVDKIYQAMGYGVMQSIYCNGYLIVAQESARTDCPTKILVLDASDGSIVKSYTASNWSGACGHPAFSYGRLFKGDLRTNKVLGWQIGTGDKNDFAPFGTHKLNSDNAPDTALAALDANITALSSISGGTQGGIIYNGQAFFNNDGPGNGVVCFDIETLAVIRNYTSDTTWDSSPMVVKNVADQDVLLVKENTNKRVKAMLVSDGSTLWYSDADMEGNLFFGFTYYESSFVNMIDGMTSAEYIAGLNDNFTALNSLVGDAATLTTITDDLIGQDLLDAVNDNIAALNAELGTPVAWTDIVLGELGSSANTKLNNFNIAFKLAV